jgi:hypothetical protein
MYLQLEQQITQCNSHAAAAGAAHNTMQITMTAASQHCVQFNSPSVVRDSLGKLHELHDFESHISHDFKSHIPDLKS